MVANRNRGTKELLEVVAEVAEGKIKMNHFKVEYGREVEEEIAKLEKLISQNPFSLDYSPRWLAIKLLEEDEEIIKKFEGVRVG
jgi:ferrous iron transport protein B